MNVIGNELLGLIFLGLAGVLTLLMYYAWGFPFDKERHRSSAPSSVVWTHRILGFCYLAIYIYLMWQMIPRLWAYQIELPARTVAHLLLGIAIGGILFIKLLVVRFFKHLEAKLVPFLGTALFICTLMMVSLAIPFTLRETFLREAAVMGDSFTTERLDRVRTHLPKIGLDDTAAVAALATSEGLLLGRKVLMAKCVQCHDLRTVLARPRPPESWRQTVRRMADRSTIVNPISEEEQWQVTAYLIAISPTLQRSLKQKRSLDKMNATSQGAAAMVGKQVREIRMQDMPYDAEAARELFEAKCSLCHGVEQVANKPPESKDAAIQLITRMVSNGLIATDQELTTIIQYLTITYARAGRIEEPIEEGASRSSTEKSDEADQVLVIKPQAGFFRFEQAQLTAKAGSRLKIVFDNTASDGEHTLALLRRQDAIEDVVAASFSAADSGFIPDHEAVFAVIPITPPGGTNELVIEVPPPGDYPFLCLLPGHSSTMRGVLRSVE